MLCITAQHENPDELAHALHSAIQEARAKNIHFLVEFRFDGIKNSSEQLTALAKEHAPNAIFCVRSKSEGGAYTGSLEEQEQVLRTLAQLKPRFIDIGPSLYYAHANVRKNLCLFDTTQIIVSVHNFHGNWPEFEKEIIRLSELRNVLVKGAISLKDTAENLRLLNLSRAIKNPHVLLGMGEAGLLSRIRYRHLKSSWCYVSANAQCATAPGQISLTSALHLGLPQSANHPFLALVGDASIKNSPGPNVYNAIFRKKNLPWAYIPIATQNPRECMQTLREFGLLGASITMPHKLAFAQLSKFVSNGVIATGAANTLRVQHDKFELENTDIFGIQIPMQKAHVTRGEQCLILGSGGAALAAVSACNNLGITPIIAARDIEKARTKFPSLQVVPWSERHLVKSEILINTTPLGGRSAEIWPAAAALHKHVVFDCALSHNASLLLERARLEGATIITPQDMWVAQGAKQMQWILNQNLAEEELREHIPHLI